MRGLGGRLDVEYLSWRMRFLFAYCSDRYGIVKLAVVVFWCLFGFCFVWLAVSCLCILFYFVCVCFDSNCHLSYILTRLQLQFLGPGKFSP